MRIAFAAHSGEQVGGVEAYVRRVVPALVAAGHDVSCWLERGEANGEPLFRPVDDVTCFKAGDQPQAALDALQRWKPDVLYSQGIASPSREQELLNVAPSVVFCHSYYGTCISGSKMQQRPTQQCCTREFGVGCLLQYYPRRCGGRSPLTMLRQYRLQQDRLELLASYDRLVVASRHMADEYAKHGLQDKVRVVPLPIESVHPSHASAEDDGTWRLLYLGRLEEIKGAHIAVESAAIVAASSERPVHLQVSGNGSLRGRLQQQADILMARHSNLTITITGWLREEQCSDAVSWAHVLLVPSCWPEPFGMVGIEAAQRGVPTVAFAVGGIPEWLSDGVNGRLVPGDPPDSNNFAEGITACLADSQTLNRMRAGSRIAARGFGLDAHVRQLETVLAEVR